MTKQNADSDLSRLRLDKWLWAARFYKTRSLAKQAIEGGKVQCNGSRAKPSKEIEVGAEIRLRQGFDERTVRVCALSEQRRGAPEAQQLYAETEESIKQREQLSEQRKSQPQITTNSKPNKRDRRLIHRFMQIE
jgi:ribosome-associated heat shock protein Hsp15